MIKELNYYLSSNRFSQIAEEIDNSVREYAESLTVQNENFFEVRENARKICSKYAVSSGMKEQNNSFINVDAEFFEGGELIEENLNRFIKEVLKAHGYQKILWEYMGTTGFMTEISKSAMKNDGYSYENFLPVELKEIEKQKSTQKLTREFNKLKDESGFDWSKGYNPNYSVEKKGWFSDYDENGVWTRFVTEKDKETSEKLNNPKKTYNLHLIKTENGCMLYDPEMLLLNPLLLWYFTLDDEVYGAEESDTLKIIKEIKPQMERLGVKKITEISWNKKNVVRGKESEEKRNQEIFNKYKEVLDNLADEKMIFVDSLQAQKRAALNAEVEKNAIIQKELQSLQKTIDAVINSKPNCNSEELVRYIQTGKIEIPCNIIDEEDAEIAGLNEDEYQTFISFASKLQGNKRADFADICAVLSSSWMEYKSCAKSKEECMKLLFDYVKEQKENDFNYEMTLKQVLDQPCLQSYSENEMISYEKEVEVMVKENLPAENQETALEYISSLPEQTAENKEKVYKTLCSAVKNYLKVRMSTGMSIKELFDYAVKSSGGKLPKSSFTPPVVGYINPNAQGSSLKDSIGEKRIYFEGKVSSLYNSLKLQNLPKKEVPLTILQENYEKYLNKKRKPLVSIGFSASLNRKNAGENKAKWFDIGTAEAINPIILTILKSISIEDKETKSKILEIAKNSKDAEIFISKLAKDFKIEYNLADEEARERYLFERPNVSKEFLDAYLQDFEEKAEKIVENAEYQSSQNVEISPLFTQVNLSEFKTNEAVIVEEIEAKNRISIPVGYKLMKQKTNAGGVLEKISRMSVQKLKADIKEFSEIQSEKSESKLGFVIEKAINLEETYLNIEDKKVVKLIFNDLSEREQSELLYVVGEDWNNITPLLIKEFIWRKKNNKSTQNILNEISVYEKLKEIPQTDLEKYFTSSIVNADVEKISFDKESLTFCEDESLSVVESVKKLTNIEKEYLQTTYGLQTEDISPVIEEYIKSGEWKKTKDIILLKETIAKAAGKEETEVVKLFIEKLNAFDKKELINAAGGKQDNITALLLKEYLWRKNNEKSVKNLKKELTKMEVLQKMPEVELEKLVNSTSATVHYKSATPLVKLTREDKAYYKQTYGINTDILSPVLKAYIRNGGWKQSRSRQQSGDGSKPNQNSSQLTMAGIGSSDIPSPIVTSTKISGFSESKAKVPITPDVQVSEPLKEVLGQLAEMRQNKKPQSQEMTKLERMNANYEHDKAVLAKADPMFAKNQFWDIGHAEGDGEILDHNLIKNYVEEKANKQIEEINFKK